jgi:exodeoxyribonuclease VII small subunit
MKEKLNSFDAAFEELTKIAKELEEHNLPLEELSKKVERAAELRDFCKKRLREVETQLDRFNDGDQNH